MEFPVQCMYNSYSRSHHTLLLKQCWYTFCPVQLLLHNHSGQSLLVLYKTGLYETYPYQGRRATACCMRFAPITGRLEATSTAMVTTNRPLYNKPRLLFKTGFCARRYLGTLASIQVRLFYTTLQYVNGSFRICRGCNFKLLTLDTEGSRTYLYE